MRLPIEDLLQSDHGEEGLDAKYRMDAFETIRRTPSSAEGPQHASPCAVRVTEKNLTTLQDRRGGGELGT